MIWSFSTFLSVVALNKADKSNLEPFLRNFERMVCQFSVGIEGIKVSVFNSDSAALSSAVVLVNNTGSAATSQSFTLTTGVNEFTGGSGNDSFDGSTSDSLNDYDILDIDFLTFQYAFSI